MNRTPLGDLIFILILIPIQIFVLNRITIMGAYTPVIYPIFVLFYPFFRNQYHFIAFSFLLGLGIDAFMGTWGINALATMALAYFRTLIFRSSTDTTMDFFTFSTLQWSQFLFFVLISIIGHQFLVHLIEFFKLSRILEILLGSIISSLISFVFILAYILIFRVKQKV